MPISIRKSPGGRVYANPFVGPTDYRATVRVTPADLTSAEVDAKGYIKPGVPFTQAGTLVAEPEENEAQEPVFGVTLEAVRIADGNSEEALEAGKPQDLAVVTIGQINRQLAEDNLGREFTAAELAGFAAAGCTIKLLA